MTGVRQHQSSQTLQSSGGRQLARFVWPRSHHNSPARELFKRFISNPLGLAGGAILALLLIAVIFAPLIAPYGPADVNWDQVQQPPSFEHWFGTDEIGRDIFSRVVWGARSSLWIVGVSIAVAVVLGSVIGLLSGYIGGWVDDIIMRVIDAILAFPMLILALAIIAVLGPSLSNAILAIAIVNVPGFARIVRAEVLAVRNQEFVDAARSIGASDARILSLHIWPYVSGNIIIYASLKASAALITESALAFLGLGVQPPSPTWGGMLSTSMQYWDAWWMSIFPGAAIFLTVLALNFCGDALLDAKSNLDQK